MSSPCGPVHSLKTSCPSSVRRMLHVQQQPRTAVWHVCLEQPGMVCKPMISTCKQEVWLVNRTAMQHSHSAMLLRCSSACCAASRTVAADGLALQQCHQRVPCRCLAGTTALPASNTRQHLGGIQAHPLPASILRSSSISCAWRLRTAASDSTSLTTCSFCPSEHPQTGVCASAQEKPKR